ncbi:hypothetical protein [Nostoc sp. TCL240-02]|nr:hypothetical protein [Nostoc sp. TCL240-02]
MTAHLLQDACENLPPLAKIITIKLNTDKKIAHPQGWLFVKLSNRNV